MGKIYFVLVNKILTYGPSPLSALKTCRGQQTVYTEYKILWKNTVQQFPISHIIKIEHSKSTGYWPFYTCMKSGNVLKYIPNNCWYFNILNAIVIHFLMYYITFYVDVCG